MYRTIAFGLTGLLLMSSVPASALVVNEYQSWVDVEGSDVLQTGPGANIGWLSLYEEAGWTHAAGQVGTAELYDQSWATVGARVNWLTAYDAAQVDVVNSADVSWLQLYNQAGASISGGTLGYVQLLDQSNVSFDFTGGGTLSYLQFFGSGSTATVSGYDFETSGSSLSFKDAGGTAYSFQVSAFGCETIGGCAPTSVDLSQFSQLRLIDLGASAPIDAVPEPATWLVMLTGFGLVGAQIRLRRREAGGQTGRGRREAGGALAPARTR